MDQDKIERYLANRMTSDERVDFELSMSKDPQLRQEVLDLQNGIHQLKLEERAVLKSRLINLEESILEEEKIKKPKPYYWILLSLILLITVLWFKSFNIFIKKDLPSEKTPNLEIDSSFTPKTVPQETLQIREQLNPKKPKMEKIKSKDKCGELFAAHFTAYTNDELENEIRGNSEKSGYEIFKHLYINERYEKALLVLDTLDPSIINSEMVLLLKANSLMAIHNSNKAIPILEKLIANKNSNYLNDAHWYLSLCYLEKGDVKNAKDILIKYVSHGDPRFRQLLNKL